jgi:Domain of unknown function (DUF4258)
MAIERIIWTDHALLRIEQRQLARFEVEEAIRDAHDARSPNDGKADSLISASLAAGRQIEAIYDHPVRGDTTVVRVISVWRVD